MKNIKKIILILLVAALGFLGRFGCVYFDEKQDEWNRPWAYSPNKPLLVGKWEGAYADPDKVLGEIQLEIFEPTTSEERWRAYHHSGSKRGADRRFFDGIAFLATKGRRDTFELWGGLEDADGHELHFQLRPLANQRGFTPNAVNGVWKDDSIALSIEFTWHQADGSTYSDSADPRYEAKSPLFLRRMPK